MSSNVAFLNPAVRYLWGDTKPTYILCDNGESVQWYRYHWESAIRNACGYIDLSEPNNSSFPDTEKDRTVLIKPGASSLFVSKL